MSDGKTTNISGRQGFLNFDLIAEKASLKRSGLKLDSSRNQGDLVLRIRSSASAEIQFSANGENIASSKVSGTNEFSDLNFALGENWAGTIKDLKLEFKASVGTKIEIDWMRIKQLEPKLNFTSFKKVNAIAGDVFCTFVVVEDFNGNPLGIIDFIECLINRCVVNVASAWTS